MAAMFLISVNAKNHLVRNYRSKWFVTLYKWYMWSPLQRILI